MEVRKRASTAKTSKKAEHSQECLPKVLVLQIKLLHRSRAIRKKLLAPKSEFLSASRSTCDAASVDDVTPLVISASTAQSEQEQKAAWPRQLSVRCIQFPARSCLDRVRLLCSFVDVAHIVWSFGWFVRVCFGFRHAGMLVVPRLLGLTSQISKASRTLISGRRRKAKQSLYTLSTLVKSCLTSKLRCVLV